MTSLEIATIGKNTPWEFHAYNPLLTEEKVFTCPCCGEKKAYIDLEIWSSDSVEDITNNNIMCAECYENEMGDDL